jgi:hypothetical protein
MFYVRFGSIINIIAFLGRIYANYQKNTKSFQEKKLITDIEKIGDC